MNSHVPDRALVEALLAPVEPFEHDGIVERAHERVANDDVLAIADVDAVGVVAPQSDELDVGDLEVAASERAQAPDVRVAEDDAVDLHVRAVRQADASSALAPLVLARIDDAAAQNAHARGAAGLDGRVDHRPAGDVEGFAALKLDLARPVDARAKVADTWRVGLGHVGFRRIGEQVQRVMRTVHFDGHLPGLRQRERDGWPCTVGRIPRELGRTTTFLNARFEVISTVTGSDKPQWANAANSVWSMGAGSPGHTWLSGTADTRQRVDRHVLCRSREPRSPHSVSPPRAPPKWSRVRQLSSAARPQRRSREVVPRATRRSFDAIAEQPYPMPPIWTPLACSASSTSCPMLVPTNQ